jgi:hypothetical protein
MTEMKIAIFLLDASASLWPTPYPLICGFQAGRQVFLAKAILDCG